ncbi:hypothetical protein HYPDE_34928 [Hyphomicrobium denitrificans 1NES1]|uniref:Uncharacterized protein n=1 Tax=Hyphomicrobium denitrificans 1NES1 TaxID=670307 RepID=N0B8Q7_9HYPH|nr:hypothetical protein HYPDE_34928 [Hyphomicrobium denitrificans 1NES1]
MLLPEGEGAIFFYCVDGVRAGDVCAGGPGLDSRIEIRRLARSCISPVANDPKRDCNSELL